MNHAPQHATTAPLAHVDVIVLDYLAALWAAAEHLAPDQRDEVMAAVADYIAMRRGASVDPLDDAEQIVRRLGPPEELAAAAGRGRLPAHLRAPHVVRPTDPVRRGGHADHAAVALLVGGAAVLPGVGSLAGLVLASGSRRWTPTQKAAAWVLTTGAGFLGLVLLATFGPESPLVGLFVAYLALLAGSVAAGLTLIPALISRRD